MKHVYFYSLLILLNISLKAQINPRMYNENYMWTSFFDDFDDNEINRNEWEPGLIYRGIGELIDSELTHDISNSKLALSMVQYPNYNDSADYVGAEFFTKETFLYGSFECEATFAKKIGSWPAFWSFHRQPCPNNDGPEIDFAEYFCRIYSSSYQYNVMGHYVHRWFASPCGGPGNGNETVFSEENFFVTSTNLYKCIWTPEQIKFYIDGNLIDVFDRNGAQWWPSVPVSVYVSQQILQPATISGQLLTPIAPQTSYFYYVKVKNFFLAPEITCPSVICDSSYAYLDVDTLASNITWALTPGSLFSGATSGTGTSATIIPSGSYHGLGKVTFNFDMPSGESFSAEKEIRVNGPGYEDISFYVCKSTGEPANKMSGFWLLCPNTTYHIYVNNDGPCSTSNYSWSFPEAWTDFYTYQNMISINTNSSPGGPVSVDANTCCNNNVTIISDYMGSDYNCGYYYMTFTPNPVTNETTLEILKGNESEKMNPSSEDLQELQKIEWELDVFDHAQIVRKSFKKIKGNKLKLKVNGWKSGFYYARARMNNEIIYGKFIVKE